MVEHSHEKEGREGRFRLEVPLDASGVEGFKPEQPLKVVVVDGKGSVHSRTVELDERGGGAAAFDLRESPGALSVLVGPANASDEELQGMQAISLNLPSRLWREGVLKIPPIRIPPYYWFWWLRWCRTFVIRGRVVCADGRPVPGAEVCAYDVDWWFIWSSKQLVGCATTDITGSFEIKFRWCCGWWPWWWWRFRVWQLEPLLSERVGEVLRRNPDVRLSPIAGNQPSLGVFAGLLAREGLASSQPLTAANVAKLQPAREALLRKLPAAPELAALRIWPWWPWWPWWDCDPDIIFKVTQDCLRPGTVIVDEGVFETRWNIPNPLDVTLVANQEACCLSICPPGQPCPEGECIVIADVCDDPIDSIGGNIGAPAAPEGYLRPGSIVPGSSASDGDRPYGGVVRVEKDSNPNDMAGVDYYEIEVFTGGAWNPLPPGAAVNFTRHWLESGGGHGDVNFNFTPMSGHNVVESRRHFEDNGGLGGWGFTRFWLTNPDLLVPIDSTVFADGTYHFRVVGWQVDGGGNLVNRKVLPMCGTEEDNDLVLTFDNRVIDQMTHDPSHHCGGVHICTLEPDTHIIAVRINGVDVKPCDTVNAKEGTVEVDFLVTDPDGHLAYYVLNSTYGLNGFVPLASSPNITPLVPGTPWGPTYGEALGQGAVSPKWYGGRFRLTVPVQVAFPEPCCYQLQLQAWKRTKVGSLGGCGNDFGHWNLTEDSFGVGIC